MVHQQGENDMYGIWCEVSGGVTGYRCAWMKSNGELLVLTQEQAEQEAARRTKEKNSSPYRTADFTYTAKPLGSALD
jgi:hypothetical protein